MNNMKLKLITYNNLTVYYKNIYMEDFTKIVIIYIHLKIYIRNFKN
jgi:hypothetical protein